jgi:4-aminobutyrate aminotransferase
MPETTLYERDSASIGELQKLRFFPQAAVAGGGSWLRDESGRRLLDMSASWGAALLGYGHPGFASAVAAEAQAPAGASVLSGTNSKAVQLAEKLLSIVPGEGARKVWFGHSGSDANETVARALLRATGRNRILSFVGAYHGGTSGSIGISGHKSHASQSRMNGLQLLPYPNPYRPFLGDASGGKVLELLDYYFESVVPPEDVAALFIEPIQSDGGVVVPPLGFLARLVERCRRHGIYVVCDEVKVGLGRTGLLHCFQHEAIVPDFVTFGKGFGGGLPISAVVGPAAVLDYQQSFAMQTLQGNPICAAAALAVLDTIENEDLVTRARVTGEKLMKGLSELKDRSGIVGDVRGRGLAVGIELVTDTETRTPNADAAARLVHRCFELGVIVYYVGTYSNVIELTPPLTVSDEDVDIALSAVRLALDDVMNGWKPAASFRGW